MQAVCKNVANFLQITINSQERKHKLFDLNNIGMGDFVVTFEQTRQNIESETVWGISTIISGRQKLHLQIYQKSYKWILLFT